jgi:hypothetical protein
MTPILFLSLALAAASPDSSDLPWRDLVLSIEKDRSVSSDTVTFCRVRVVNLGGHTWQGRLVRFEAAAVEAGVVVARERGRFGLTLSPHDTLETVIAFEGLFDRFEVRPLFKGTGDRESKSRHSGRGKSAKKKRKSRGHG